MWGIPNNPRHLARWGLFGEIPTALSFEQSIINRLVTDFLESSVDYSSHECEFHVYLDENLNAGTLEDLPRCQIWHELRFFTGGKNNETPQFRAPFTSDIFTGGGVVKLARGRN